MIAPREIRRDETPYQYGRYLLDVIEKYYEAEAKLRAFCEGLEVCSVDTLLGMGQAGDMRKLGMKMAERTKEVVAKLEAAEAKNKELEEYKDGWVIQCNLKSNELEHKDKVIEVLAEMLQDHSRMKYTDFMRSSLAIKRANEQAKEQR